MNRLLAIAENGNDADALRAIGSLLDRLYGKPKATVEHRGEENPLRAELLRIPQEERRAWLRDLNCTQSLDEAAEH